MKWPTACLGELCQINIGRTPSRSEPAYWEDGNNPWLSISDMGRSKIISSTKEGITDTAIHECSMRPVQAGTVLFSFKLSIGKLGIAAANLFTNEAIASLPILDRTLLCEDYLFHALQQISGRLVGDRAAMGTTLNKASLAQIEIPLPPLEEQRRIASILDKAHQVKELGGQRDLQINQLELGLFLESFGNPITNALDWPTVNIGQIARVQTGNTPSRARTEYYGDEVEWIKSDNLNNSSYYATKAAVCLSALGASFARIAPRDAILVTCIAGSPACIGNCAMVDRAVAFNQQINSLEDMDGNPHFFYAMLRLFKGIVQAASTKSMKGMVSKSRFESICIINPPRERQDLFAAKMAVVRRLQCQANELTTSTDTLIQGLHKRFFMGPQVP